jgi:hypothetical protein
VIQNNAIGMYMPGFNLNSTFPACIMYCSKQGIYLRICGLNLCIFPVRQRIPLDFLEGEKFQEAADNYVRPLLTKVSASLVCR